MIMYPALGHKGPYFFPPCQRDRFPSLLDELGESGDQMVSHLGISNMSDMGARLKRGRKYSNFREQQAANSVKESGVPMQEIFCTSTQEQRRGVDKFVQIPFVFNSRVNRSDGDSMPAPAPARRQAGEPPYTGKCQHCRRRGSDDVANDFNGKRYLGPNYRFDRINVGDPDGEQQENVELPVIMQRHRNFG